MLGEDQACQNVFPSPANIGPMPILRSLVHPTLAMLPDAFVDLRRLLYVGHADGTRYLPRQICFIR